MTQQEEDKHIFLGIKPGNKLENEDPITEKEPIEGFYVSLYDELKEKCDPVCFFKPYDKVKVDIANDIYDGILKNEENIEELKHLRLRAINELGVKFSTAKLYADLVDICNPDNFSRINYDNAKLGLANKLFDQIKKHADDILALEKIQEDASELIKEMQKRREKKNAENKIQTDLKKLLDKRVDIISEKENQTISVIIVSLLVALVACGISYDYIETLAYILFICVIIGGAVVLYQIRKGLDKHIDDIDNKIKILEQTKNIES